MKTKIKIDDGKCRFCRSTNIERHHIFFGNKNRKKSEKWGAVISLCPYHHRGTQEGVHHNRSVSSWLQAETEWRFYDNGWTREEFFEEFGRHYI